MIANNLPSLLATTQNKMAIASTAIDKVGSFGAIKNMSNAQIDNTAKDFESMFVSQMLEQMFGDSIGSELFGSEDTGEVYKGLMMEEYGRLIAASGGIGIASYVKGELLRLQEV